MPTFNPNIPQASNLLSQSQADILNNFTALNAILNVNAGVLNLPVNATGPTTTANTPAIYSKLNTAGTPIPALFWRQQSNGAEIDFTTFLKASTGWCQLPCGIILQWGTGTLTNSSSTATVSFAIAFPTSCYSVQLSPTNAASGDARDAIIAASSASTTGFSAVRNSSYKGSQIGFNYIALGV